jgi:hypothetical protein
MNANLGEALKIYGKDFHELLYWHLCFGVVIRQDLVKSKI